MFILYNPETGAIEASAEVSDRENYSAVLTGIGRTFIEIEGKLLNPLQHYRVVAGELIELSAISVVAPDQAIVGQECVLSNVPPGCMVSFEGETYGPIEDGVMEFTPANPGLYQFRFYLTDHVSQEITLEARPLS